MKCFLCSNDLPYKKHYQKFCSKKCRTAYNNLMRSTDGNTNGYDPYLAIMTAMLLPEKIKHRLILTPRILSNVGHMILENVEKRREITGAFDYKRLFR